MFKNRSGCVTNGTKSVTKMLLVVEVMMASLRQAAPMRAKAACLAAMVSGTPSNTISKALK
jgi:hypothetical protein